MSPAKAITYVCNTQRVTGAYPAPEMYSGPNPKNESP
jgi:hypothetical protein